MRTLVFLFSFFISTGTIKAEGPYRTYLLTKIYSSPPNIQQQHFTAQTSVVESEAGIPRYQIPKGNIFCRMEDKLTKATKLWIKVGVQ